MWTRLACLCVSWCWNELLLLEFSFEDYLELYSSAARCYLFSFSAAISCIMSLMYIDIHCITLLYQCCISMYYSFIPLCCLLNDCYKLRRIGFERSNLRHSNTIWSMDVDFWAGKIRLVTVLILDLDSWIHETFKLEFDLF